MEISGVILAGGQASRMGGGDKGLLRLGGATLLDHVISRLSPQCTALAINANGNSDRFRPYNLPVLPDGIEGQPGPLAGILAAMEWAAAEGTQSVVTVAADTPFFPRDLVARLAEPAGLALASSQQPGEAPMQQPVFGLWPVELRGDLRSSLLAGQRKVRQWAAQHNAAQVVFPHDGVDPFFNVNTPEDLKQARALARGDQCFRMK